MSASHIIQIIIIIVIVVVTLQLTKILLTHGGPKEPRLVGKEPSTDELFLQIDYLIRQHNKTLEENKRLIAECQALREKSVYSVK